MYIHMNKNCDLVICSCKMTTPLLPPPKILRKVHVQNKEAHNIYCFNVYIHVIQKKMDIPIMLCLAHTENIKIVKLSTSHNINEENRFIKGGSSASAPGACPPPPFEIY